MYKTYSGNRKIKLKNIHIQGMANKNTITINIQAEGKTIKLKYGHYNYSTTISTHAYSYLSTSRCPLTFVTAAMYLMMILDASVFPEPLSP